uniref:Uncharacterized protein n=1 Tax=Octopus bimaculoides TaxID=37653 RepID=A0A0L8HCX7_OCTBM
MVDKIGRASSRTNHPKKVTFKRHVVTDSFQRAETPIIVSFVFLTTRQIYCSKQKRTDDDNENDDDDDDDDDKDDVESSGGRLAVVMALICMLNFSFC